MEYLIMNGAFYNFLISQCTINFKHYDFIFDWIPVSVRMQLVKLLDAWKAAEMRWKRLEIDWEFQTVEVQRAYLERRECETLFRLTLKKAYQDAEKLHELSESNVRPYPLYAPPEPNLDFWRQVHEREMYEAREAAGEPVVFHEGHCCLCGSLDRLIYRVIPGAYPGLQYYRLEHNLSCPSKEMRVYLNNNMDPWMENKAFFLELANRAKGEDRNIRYDPIPMDWDRSDKCPHPATVRRRLVNHGVIGPASFAEYRGKDAHCYWDVLTDKSLFTVE